jgi:hypothetical protein
MDDVEKSKIALPLWTVVAAEKIVAELRGDYAGEHKDVVFTFARIIYSHAQDLTEPPECKPDDVTLTRYEAWR